MDADVYWLGRHVGLLREVVADQPYYLGEWVPVDDPQFAAALASGNGVPVVLWSRDGADAAPAWALVGPLAPLPGVCFRFGAWSMTRPLRPKEGDREGADPLPHPLLEGGVAALMLGRAEEALALCRSAVSGRPADAGLVCNLALAYCLAGQDAEAERCAAGAAGHDTSDGISYVVLGLIRDVAADKRPRPKQISEEFLCG